MASHQLSDALFFEDLDFSTFVQDNPSIYAEIGHEAHVDDDAIMRRPPRSVSYAIIHNASPGAGYATRHDASPGGSYATRHNGSPGVSYASVESPFSDGMIQMFTPGSVQSYTCSPEGLGHGSLAGDIPLEWFQSIHQQQGSPSQFDLTLHMNQTERNSVYLSGEQLEQFTLTSDYMGLDHNLVDYSPMSETLAHATGLTTGDTIRQPQQNNSTGRYYPVEHVASRGGYHETHQWYDGQPSASQQVWPQVVPLPARPYMHPASQGVSFSHSPMQQFTQLLPQQVVHVGEQVPQTQSTPRGRRQLSQARRSRADPRVYGPAPSRDHQRQRILPHGTVPMHSEPRVPNKGGRHGCLADDVRATAQNCRKTGACWPCVLQRDTCEKGEGDKCQRCNNTRLSVLGITIPLQCDRTKLPVLLQDFLPFSMTQLHQKQVVLRIMDTDAVGGVPKEGDAREVTVWLTAGFGPDLPWTMVEFLPKDKSVTVQFQFFQDPETRLMEKRDKYSPPFAIRSLSREESSFEEYLEDILSSKEHLMDFAQVCSVVEGRYETFPGDILRALCILYIHTEDEELQVLMKRILRMLILTNIMVHTLTIVEGTLPATLQQLERSPAPQQFHEQKQTSPKLANRQLKFFFSIKREEIYLELLKYGQKVLRTGGDKDKTWMPMFVLVLAFALVHEEIQSILQIQAVSKSAKNEMTWKDSQKEAADACQRIDDKFNLLIAVFQHKYRSDKWTSCGSFGNRTPALSDAATNVFLGTVRKEVERKVEYLRGREVVPLGHEQQCNYTSRLVARFLLPFLGLPP